MSTRRVLVAGDEKNIRLTLAAMLEDLHEAHPDLHPAKIPANGTVATAVDAMEARAAEFVARPFTPADIRHLVAEPEKKGAAKAGAVAGALVAAGSVNANVAPSPGMGETRVAPRCASTASRAVATTPAASTSP